jgi:hypothetical protein
MEVDVVTNKRKREFSNNSNITKKKRTKSPTKTRITKKQYKTTHEREADLQSLLKTKKELEQQISQFNQEEKLMKRQYAREEELRIIELKKQKTKENIQQKKEQELQPITEIINEKQLFQNIKTIINENAYVNEQGKTCANSKNISLKEQAQQEFIKKYINKTINNNETTS